MLYIDASRNGAAKRGRNGADGSNSYGRYEARGFENAKVHKF